MTCLSARHVKRRHSVTSNESASCADLLHHPVGRFKRTLHPAVPPRCVLTGKEDPALPTSSLTNKPELAGSEQGKSATVPGIKLPAEGPGCFEVRVRPGENALRLAECCLGARIIIHVIKP